MAALSLAVKDVSASANLLALQSRMKCDPQGYEDELLLQLRHFEACLSVFNLHSSNKSSFVSDQNAAKELADMTMFLAHVTPFYPKHLKQFPKQILGLLQSMGDSLQPALRRQLTQALILLRNRQMIELVEILPVLMELQTLGDKNLRKLASLHIIQDIRRMNLKHKNESKNRALQNVMFQLLQDDNECRSKRALIVVCELHKRKLWVDDRTSNAICNACFHKSSRILKCTLAFLLGYENMDDEDEDESSDEEDEDKNPCVAVSRDALYKAHKKGTVSSRRKKQAKLQRVIRSLKKQQRSQADATSISSSPLQHLNDPQGFAEKLFSRLQNCNERFEVKLMMMKVISRAIGLHRLIVLNFYPFLQKYVQPHQRDVTHVLASAVQACHDMVPPDAVETLLRQLVNQFVHDRARPEVIAVGLNVVREMCARMPLIMTRELLHDLALYKKSREKAVSSAARSIIAVYRQVCPTLLEKRDRGKAADLQARPTAFGEKVVPSNVPGIELLTANDENESDDFGSNSENDNSESENDAMEDEDQNESSDEENQMDPDSECEGEGHRDDESGDAETDDASDAETFELDSDEDLGSEHSDEEDDDNDDHDEDMSFESEDEAEALQKRGEKRDGSGLSLAPESKRRKVENVNTDSLKCGNTENVDTDSKVENVNTDSSKCSLRELKKMVLSSKNSNNPSICEEGDGILSNEDFERIKRLKAKRAIREAMEGHGLAKSRKKDESIKIPNFENINERRVNPASLEANIRRRREKEERIASVRAGQEEREAYKSKTSIKQKKTGGLSNRQKEKKKNMPLAAKMAKASKSRDQKAAKRKRSNQFRGRKAWK